MKLCKPHVVGILDDERVHIRDVNAGFYYRGADKHVKASVKKMAPNLQHLFLGHFAVCNAYPRFRDKRTYFLRAAVYRVYAVVDIVHLTAAPQFLFDSLHYHAPVVFHDIGGYRLSVLGRFVDNAHVAYSAHRHVEGPRNRRCR